MAKDWEAELKWAYENGELGYANEVREYLGMEPIGTKGGSWGQRAAIGGSKGPDAQLLAAQNIDPNAQRFGEDNFIVNGQLNNPKGFELNDLAQWGRPVAETAGALIGGAMAFGGGIPTGPLAIGTGMAGAGVGGEIAGQLYDKGMEYFGGQEDTRDIEEFTKDATVNMAFNSMGTPQFTNPKHYINYMEEAFKPLNKAKDEVIKRGGMLTAGQTGSETAARAEAALEGDPFSGAIIGKQRGQTRQIFSDLVDEATVGATTPETAGQGAVEGINLNMDFGRAKVSEAYRLFDETLETAGGDKLNRISMKALQNASREFKELLERDLGFAEMVYSDPDLRSAMSAIDEMVANAGRNAADPSAKLVEKPSYEVIKQLRSIIGNKVNDAFNQGSEKQGLKRLYSILTDDLDDGAVEIGGEAALKARKNADAMNTQLQNDLKMIDPVFKHADNPTKVYSAITSALTNNPSLAKTARISMGPEQWSRYVDTWIHQASRTKAGMLTGEEVSSNTLLTNLQKLKQQSPEGYAVLVDGKEDVIDVIEELAIMMRQGDQFVNRSRTGNVTGAQQIASEASTGLAAGLAGAAAGGGNPMVAGASAAAGIVARAAIPKLFAHAMTSRPLAKALRAVKGKYGENLPIGADLARALVAAGASKDEVKEIFQEEKPPLQAASNEGALYQ